MQVTVVVNVTTFLLPGDTLLQPAVQFLLAASVLAFIARPVVVLCDL